MRHRPEGSAPRLHESEPYCVNGTYQHIEIYDWRQCARLNRQGGRMKLYNHSQAPTPRRVRIFMAEKGISLPMEEVDLMAGKNRTPEFLAKNPSGGLPVLELDDGGCIAESVAICRYLEGQHPEPNLMGRNPRQQAKIH